MRWDRDERLELFRLVGIADSELRRTERSVARRVNDGEASGDARLNDCCSTGELRTASLTGSNAGMRLFCVPVRVPSPKLTKTDSCSGG